MAWRLAEATHSGRNCLVRLTGARRPVRQRAAGPGRTDWRHACTAAAAAAGAAATVTLIDDADEPILAVTRTTSSPATTPATSTLTIEAAFRGLDPSQIASTTVTVNGTILATAAFGPAPDGTATRTLTLDHIATNAIAVVDARAGKTTCTATLRPDQAAEVTCTQA